MDASSNDSVRLSFCDPPDHEFLDELRALMLSGHIKTSRDIQNLREKYGLADVKETHG